MAKVFGKVSSRLGALRRIRKNLTLDAANKVYINQQSCQYWIIVMSHGIALVRINVRNWSGYKNEQLI